MYIQCMYVCMYIYILYVYTVQIIEITTHIKNACF